MPLPKLREPDELAPLIALLPDNAIVVEVGSFAGESAAQFLASPKVRKLYCIDNWVGGYDPGDRASNANMDEAKALFMDRTAADRQILRCVVIEQHSSMVAMSFPSRVADMVYLDANHLYDPLMQDLYNWQPAVRDGGFIAGHDFDMPGHPDVKRAVLALLGEPDFVLPDTSWAKRIRRPA